MAICSIPLQAHGKHFSPNFRQYPIEVKKHMHALNDTRCDLIHEIGVVTLNEA